MFIFSQLIILLLDAAISSLIIKDIIVPDIPNIIATIK